MSPWLVAGGGASRCGGTKRIACASTDWRHGNLDAIMSVTDISAADTPAIHTMRSRETRPADYLPLTPVVLHILLSLADGEQHGYAIAQSIEALTEGAVRMGPGTLYG